MEKKQRAVSAPLSSCVLYPSSFHLHSFLFLLHKRKDTHLIVSSLLVHIIVQRIITQVSLLQFGPFTDVISVTRIGFVINTIYILAALHSF